MPYRVLENLLNECTLANDADPVMHNEKQSIREMFNQHMETWAKFENDRAPSTIATVLETRSGSDVKIQHNVILDGLDNSTCVVNPKSKSRVID